MVWMHKNALWSVSFFLSWCWIHQDFKLCQQKQIEMTGINTLLGHASKTVCWRVLMWNIFSCLVWGIPPLPDISPSILDTWCVCASIYILYACVCVWCVRVHACELSRRTLRPFIHWSSIITGVQDEIIAHWKTSSNAELHRDCHCVSKIHVSESQANTDS
jgi:hypothetical protein